MKLGLSLLCFLHIIHGFYGNIELTCGTVNPLLPANVTCTCQYVGNSISWFHPNGTKLVNCFQSLQCFPTINGFMFSIDSASLYRMTIINYRYSDCLYFSCRDISESTIQKSARPLPSEFHSTTPVSLNEPNSNHSNGTITFTTACVFQYSKINYTWYIVIDGSERKYDIDKGRFVFESNNSSCNQCAGDALATLTIGFNHTEAGGKGAQTVLFQVKIHHEDYPLDVINLTSKHAYSVQVNEHRVSIPDDADDTIYLIVIPVVVCLLLVGCVIGIYYCRKKIGKTKRNADEDETPLSPKRQTISNDSDKSQVNAEGKGSEECSSNNRDMKPERNKTDGEKVPGNNNADIYQQPETQANDSDKSQVITEGKDSEDCSQNNRDMKPVGKKTDGEKVPGNNNADIYQPPETPGRKKIGKTKRNADEDETPFINTYIHHTPPTISNDSDKSQVKAEGLGSEEYSPNNRDMKPEENKTDGEKVPGNNNADIYQPPETPANDSDKSQVNTEGEGSEECSANNRDMKPEGNKTDGEKVPGNNNADIHQPPETSGRKKIGKTKRNADEDETPLSPTPPTISNDSNKSQVKAEGLGSEECSPNNRDMKPEGNKTDGEKVPGNNNADIYQPPETPANDSDKSQVNTEGKGGEECCPNNSDMKPEGNKTDGEKVPGNNNADIYQPPETPAKDRIYENGSAFQEMPKLTNLNDGSPNDSNDTIQEYNEDGQQVHNAIVGADQVPEAPANDSDNVQVNAGRSDSEITSPNNSKRLC